VTNRAAALAACVAAAALLAGCGRAAAPPPPAARSTVLTHPAAVTAPVTAAAARIRSARFTMSETLGATTFTHTGARTFTGRRLALLTGELGGDGRYELRQVGGLLYVRMPLLQNEFGRPWVRLDHLSGILAGQSRDLVALLRQRVNLTSQAGPATAAALLAGTTSLESGGVRTVHGVRVQQYAGTLDVAAAAREPALRATLAALGDGRPVTEVNVQLAVGPRSLPVRLVVDFQSAYGHGHVVVDYLRYDVPVRVVVPPPSQVDDLGVMLVGS
jgi:hypothetical protein